MIEKVYKNFKEEAELFFVKRFIDTPKIAEKYKFVLDAVFSDDDFDEGFGDY